MVSLKQITSVTVTSPWSSANTSNQWSRGAIVNPTYPIFFFDYQTYQIAVGYVVGSTGYALFNQGDCNYLVMPGIYLQFLGYNYWIGGGGECSVSGCMNNGTNACGPWWAIADLSSNTVNTYCTGLIPNNPITTHLEGIVADLVNQNLLLANSTDQNQLFLWAIPFSSISQALQNQTPSGMKWGWFTNSYIQNNGFSAYTQNPVIYNGNLLDTLTSSSESALWVIPLSTVYQNMTTGTPSSSSSPVSVGNVYILGSVSTYVGQRISIFATPSSSGINISIAVGARPGTNFPLYVWIVNPSNFSVTNSTTYSPTSAEAISPPAVWDGVFVLGGQTSSGVVLVVFDPKTMTGEYTTTSGSFITIGSEGYVAIASQTLNSSSVTWTVYQILLDHTYVFQNISVNVTGSTITATGTLYDLSTNSAVANATVYLVALRSLGDQYSNDVIVIASGTTNSNGQFSVSGTVQSGYKWYGILYVP